MSLRRYTKHDKSLIASWYKARGKKAPRPGALPATGFIADNRVAGWLYLTDSNIAMIDGVIANPESVPSLRRASLKKLCGHLVDTALLLGYTNIIALTTHPSIRDIAEDMGFRATPHTLYILSERPVEDDLNENGNI